MDIQQILADEFSSLQNRIKRLAYNHYIPEHDADDLIQDVCVEILEQKLTKQEYSKAISRVIGRYRERRDRERKRE